MDKGWRTKDGGGWTKAIHLELTTGSQMSVWWLLAYNWKWVNGDLITNNPSSCDDKSLCKDAQVNGWGMINT